MAGSFDGTFGSDPEHQDRPHRWLGSSILYGAVPVLNRAWANHLRCKGLPVFDVPLARPQVRGNLLPSRRKIRLERVGPRKILEETDRRYGVVGCIDFIVGHK